MGLEPGLLGGLQGLAQLLPLLRGQALAWATLGEVLEPVDVDSVKDGVESRDPDRSPGLLGRRRDTGDRPGNRKK